MQRIRDALSALIRARPTPEAIVVHRLLPALQAAIQARKDGEGLFDFNDMIDQVHAGLARPGLVERLRERYAAALIDEFQDTDARQWEIFRRVFHAPGHRLTLVGDPKQAIYDFRGGDLPTYLQARAALEEGGGGRLDLTRNFRSSRDLITAVNAVLAPDEAPFFTGANAYPAPVTPGRPAIRLHQDGAELPPLRLLRVPINAKVGKLRARIAAGIAAEFRSLVDAAPTFEPDTGRREDARPLHAGDLMVLTHSRAEGLVMAAALRDAGLPVAFFKADGLFQTLEALELRDLLRGILDPDDPDARGRALLTRFFGLDLAQAEACLELPADHPVLARLERWQELLRQRRYPRLFNAILEESGIVARLLITEAGDRALTNLHHLLEHLRAEALAAHLGGEDLLARLEAWIRHDDFPAADEADTQRAEGEARAVRILTIHKAKGLEAPVVAVFGGYSKGPERNQVHRFHDGAGVRSAYLGAVPAHGKQALEAEAAEEDQRLLYVALTRPKVQLVLPVFEVDDPAKVGGQSSFDAEGHPKGRHGLLNRRLRALQAGEPWQGWTVPLLEPVTAAAATAAAAPLGLPPVLPKPQEPEFRALAKAGRPLQLLSFTALHRAFGEVVRGASRDEEGRADEVEAPRPLRAVGGLPGGTATGSALHELLELVPAGSTIGSDLTAWSGRHQPLAQARLRWNGLDESLAPEALRLAWLALTTPVPLPGGPCVALDTVSRRLPELAFQMPFPGHPDGLEGSLDLVFEAAGRLFVLDWKSNTLADGDYGAAAVAAAVEEHYALQVRIYTLAALAFAGIHDEAAFEARFGGVVYLFLRGLPAGGVWTHRPTWTEVQGWREALAETPLEDLALARMERGMHG
ncbi:MAG: UvrD-helicase domain-containing protein [Holophagaceae bacterium]|nr:UvrD-helicase domain-containing protein [Holophagaceae bacterium]